MSDAQLSDQCVDRAHLYPGPPAVIPELRGFDVIAPIGTKRRERIESCDDLPTRFGTGKSLQQFLKYKAGRDDDDAAFERLPQGADLGNRRSGVAAKCKRPNARVDKQAQGRERSDL